MKLVYALHALASCWNNGNAHFQRGVLEALQRRGVAVTALTPADGWSRRSLVEAGRGAALDDFARCYPTLRETPYASLEDLDAAIDGADVVIVHEWTEPAVAHAIASRARAVGARLLLHDTHHRLISDPKAIAALGVAAFDAVLAFGESLAGAYERLGWGRRAYVWREAADVRRFRPYPDILPGDRFVFVGNWGEGERGGAMERYLVEPITAERLSLDVYGVRYAPQAEALLDGIGARRLGHLANADAPGVIAAARGAIHVPRDAYRQTLAGIPTIRVYETLACGTPLVCAPWRDLEGQFNPGADVLIAQSPADMRRLLRQIAHDDAFRAAVSRAGVETIRSRHTCDHRADELLAILAELGVPREKAA